LSNGALGAVSQRRRRWRLASAITAVGFTRAAA
jgi:hypothetical protein